MGDRSIENPIIKTLINPKYKSIPLFFKQPGAIPGSFQIQNYSEEEHSVNEVYLHKFIDKIKAHEPSGVSRHTVWELDRDPTIEPISRDDLVKFLNTLGVKKPVKFFRETG